MEIQRGRGRQREGSTIRGTTEEVIAAARQLRTTMTPAEHRLWERLRAKRFHDLSFRRQHPVGPFILDFWCPSCKLVIEVDGTIHDEVEQAQHDQLRSERLRNYGYTILRFRNEEVLAELPSVLARIAQAALSRQPRTMLHRDATER